MITSKEGLRKSCNNTMSDDMHILGSVEHYVKGYALLIIIMQDAGYFFCFAAAETRNTGSSESSGPNCAICLTEPRNTALLCGHQLCWDCAQKVDHCPVCRKFVTHRIQLF